SRAFTDVPAQNHFFGLQPLGKTPGDAVGDAFVQLRAQLAADVIRLEAGDSRHKRSLFDIWFGLGLVTGYCKNRHNNTALDESTPVTSPCPLIHASVSTASLLPISTPH